MYTCSCIIESPAVVRGLGNQGSTDAQTCYHRVKEDPSICQSSSKCMYLDGIVAVYLYRHSVFLQLAYIVFLSCHTESNDKGYS